MEGLENAHKQAQKTMLILLATILGCGITAVLGYLAYLHF